MEQVFWLPDWISSARYLVINIVTWWWLHSMGSGCKWIWRWTFCLQVIRTVYTYSQRFSPLDNCWVVPLVLSQHRHHYQMQAQTAIMIHHLGCFCILHCCEPPRQCWAHQHLNCCGWQRFAFLLSSTRLFFQILLQSPRSEIYGFWVTAHRFLLKDAHLKKLPGVLPLPLLQQGSLAVPMATIRNGTTPYWCLQAGPWSAMSFHSGCQSAPPCSLLRVIHSAQHGPLEGTCPLAYFYP